MSKSNYKLLTSCIVSALHPNEPIAAGTVFNAKDYAGGEQEAKQLVLLGYAEVTDEAPTHNAEKPEADPAAISGLEEDEDAPLKLILGGNVESVKEAIASGSLTPEQIKRLGELNILSEKPRQGVEDAVEAALAE
jgi:hypothetical protein